MRPALGGRGSGGEHCLGKGWKGSSHLRKQLARLSPNYKRKNIQVYVCIYVHRKKTEMTLSIHQLPQGVLCFPSSHLLPRLTSQAWRKSTRSPDKRHTSLCIRCPQMSWKAEQHVYISDPRLTKRKTDMYIFMCKATRPGWYTLKYKNDAHRCLDQVYLLTCICIF